MSTLTDQLGIDRNSLADFCRRHHIRSLSLFGSVVRDDFGPNSDVDVLVDYEPGHAPGWEVVDIEEELGHLFGDRKIDLVNRKYLSRRLRDRILATEVLQYEDGDGKR
ncbi:MAG: nucleotidyltransferase family protein [Isosphaerales bacterium]